MSQRQDTLKFSWRGSLLFFLWCLIISAIAFGIELLAGEFAYQRWGLADVRLGTTIAMLIGIMFRPQPMYGRRVWQWALAIAALFGLAFLMVGSFYASSPDKSPPLVAYWLLAYATWLPVFCITVWARRWAPESFTIQPASPEQQSS